MGNTQDMITPRTVHFGPPCRPVVRGLFVQGDVPWSSVLHDCFPLPSAILSTSTLSLRNILSFWNWSLSFQVSSLPLFSVVPQKKIDECKFFLHLFYFFFMIGSPTERASTVFITALHELEILHARCCMDPVHVDLEISVSKWIQDSAHTDFSRLRLKTPLYSCVQWDLVENSLWPQISKETWALSQ